MLSRKGDYEASLRELERVLVMQPENDVVWYTRGLQFARLERESRAADRRHRRVRHAHELDGECWD